jgi:transcriptional regulator with XRE-family HTH domain
VYAARVSTSETMGGAIKSARMARGWSQNELADRADVNVRSLSRWENGGQLLNPANLRRLATALDVPVSSLYQSAHRARTLSLDAAQANVHAVFATASPPERVALTRNEAAAALGISLDSFERHVQSEIKMVRRGSLRMVPVKELERWVDENAEKVLP